MKTYIIRGSRHVQTRRFSSLHKGLADGMIKKDTGRAAADLTPVGRIHTHLRRTRRRWYTPGRVGTAVVYKYRYIPHLRRPNGVIIVIVFP